MRRLHCPLAWYRRALHTFRAEWDRNSKFLCLNWEHLDVIMAVISHSHINTSRPHLCAHVSRTSVSCCFGICFLESENGVCYTFLSVSTIKNRLSKISLVYRLQPIVEGSQDRKPSRFLKAGLLTTKTTQMRIKPSKQKQEKKNMSKLIKIPQKTKDMEFILCCRQV